jgi:hypothetical protein
MSRARRRFTGEPRGLTRREAAEYLGHTESWLTKERLDDLQESGFPEIDPLTERFDRHAIDVWLDQRSRLVAVDESPNAGLPSPEKLKEMARERLNGLRPDAVRN